MNYLSTLIRNKDESEKDFRARILKKRQAYEKKFYHERIIAIRLMDTVHFYREVSK